MTKDEFIGNYLDKNMKNHGLPYGMAYLNKVATHEEEALKKWKAKERAEKLKKTKHDLKKEN